MKIGFYNQALNSGHQYRGIGFYTKNLLDYLKKDSQVEIKEFANLSKLKDVDLVHYPSFDLFRMSLPLKKRFPTVVTIHDVTPLLFPEFYPPGIKGKIKFHFQKLSLKSINAVITDSENSKKDIIKYLKIEPEKIFPIYLAPDTKFRVLDNKSLLTKIQDKYKLPKDFAIFVGSVNWNKNLNSIAEACLKSGCDLALIGKDFLNHENLNHPELRSFRDFLQKYENDPQIHILGFVETDDLVAILNQAKLLLLPSYYEGFGLPILEAQACGIPVITSNVSSMPEVAGDGAVLVDPHNVDDLMSSITKIITDRKYAESLIKKGLKNVRKFSWIKTAKETVDVYKVVIK